MVTAFIVTLLLQAFDMIPRSALVNPVIASPVPKKLQKDYDNLWQRFLKGKEDDKVMKDADKLLGKGQDLVSVTIIEAYIDLYANRLKPSEAKFEEVLKSSPANKIALSFTADFAFNREDYRRAYDLYSRLLQADPSRADVEPKRQKALLRATQDLIGSATAAEQANHLVEAEALYSQALQLAPHEPSLHERLGELFRKQMLWAKCLSEFQSAREFGGPSDEVDRRIAEALVNLGRADEARGILDRLKKSGSIDAALETKVNELEDLGRWGNDLNVFRAIQAAPTLTRAQLATLLVRYFPQLADVRKAPQIITDVRDPTSLSEIQTVVGNALLDLRPNRTFQPAAPVTRGELASALARLIARLGISGAAAPAVPMADISLSNARYREIQVVLEYGLMTLDASGNFNVGGDVSGEDGIRAIHHVLELGRRG